MQKWMLAGLIGLALAWTAPSVDACTATSVYNRATNYQDTDYYDNARDAIMTDYVIGEQDWQNEEATHAAIGTMMREAWEARGEGVNTQPAAYGDKLGTVESAREFLDDETFYGTGSHSGHGTVRDHAIYHGEQWDDNPVNGSGGGGTTVTPPPPAPTQDHAG